MAEAHTTQVYVIRKDNKTTHTSKINLPSAHRWPLKDTKVAISLRKGVYMVKTDMKAHITQT